MKRAVLSMPFIRQFGNFSNYFFMVCLLLLLAFIYWMEKEYGLITYMWESITGNYSIIQRAIILITTVI